MEAHRTGTTDGSPILIREATPDDAASVLAYLEEVSRESEFLTFGPGEFELSEPEERDFIHACALAVNSLYLVAVSADGSPEEIMGTLTVAGGQRSRVRHAAELGMSVRRRHWNRGVGAGLLSVLIRWAREGGILKKLDLRVRTDNEAAIHLYRKSGFVIEGTLRRELCVNGVYHDQHWMGLEL